MHNHLYMHYICSYGGAGGANNHETAPRILSPKTLHPKTSRQNPKILNPKTLNSKTSRQNPKS